MAKLDDKGRCCGRKPIVYKTNRYTAASERPQRFCPRCDRAYDLETGEQFANWAWHLVNGQWERKKLT